MPVNSEKFMLLTFDRKKFDTFLDMRPFLDKHIGEWLVRFDLRDGDGLKSRTTFKLIV